MQLNIIFHWDTQIKIILSKPIHLLDITQD